MQSPPTVPYAKDPLAACFHCDGPHTAASPSCPNYLLDMEILSIRMRKQISAKDERARVDAALGCWNRSFVQLGASAPSGPPSPPLFRSLSLCLSLSLSRALALSLALSLSLFQHPPKSHLQPLSPKRRVSKTRSYSLFQISGEAFESVLFFYLFVRGTGNSKNWKFQTAKIDGNFSDLT